MRINRITLRNYRGVRDATVVLSDGVTVVEGPNEIGKSSLAEAMRLIRTMPATTRHRHIRALKPVDRDVGPEVEIELTTDPYRLVFRKRWLKSSLTELTVTAPKPEHKTGNPAQTRFDEILQGSLDVDLLDALESVQGQSLAQPSLSDLASVRRALDDGDEDPDGHDDLLARIEEEHSAHFTAKTGQPTGAHLRALRQRDERSSALAQLRQASQDMDALVAEHAAHTKRWREAGAHRADAERELAEASEAARLVAELIKRAAESTAKLADARASATHASEAAAQRASEARDVEECRRRVERLNDEARAAAAAARLRAEVASGAEARRVEAEARREATQAASEDTRKRVAVRRDRLELDELRGRLERARDAKRRAREAAAELATLRIDEQTMRALEELETERRVQEGRRAAAAATIRVTALGEEVVAVGDRNVRHGEPLEAVVLEELSVEAPGVVRVDVLPGTPPAEVEARSREANHGLEAALRDAGVESLAEARSALSRRSDARTDADLAQTALDHLLAGTTLDQLEDRAATLEARLAAADEDEGRADLHELERQADDARRAEQRADAAHNEARQDWEQARSESERASADQSRATAALEGAEDELARATARLDASRDRRSDDQLAESLAGLEAILVDLGRRAEDDEAALRASHPDLVMAREENAEDLLESARSHHDVCREDVVRVEGLLDDRASRGLHDQLAEAEAAFAAAQAEAERQERAGQAVELLRRTMLDCKERAQTAYVGPFKARLEALGALVFGPGFQVEVDNDLSIVSRALDGVSVPFDMLSAGAKEQLALLSRLACAQLVDEAEGAPVILDDSLGFADPERLHAINVVLHKVGAQTQIVLLTCQPDRFAMVGGARRVRLGV